MKSMTSKTFFSQKSKSMTQQKIFTNHELFSSQLLSLNQQYAKKGSISILETIKQNILCDFEGKFKTQELQMVLDFYKKIYEESDLEAREEKRMTLKKHFKKQHFTKTANQIIQWIEANRGKQFGHLIAGTFHLKKEYFLEVSVCRSVKNLQKIPGSLSQLFQSPIQIGSWYYIIQSNDSPQNVIKEQKKAGNIHDENDQSVKKSFLCLLKGKNQERIHIPTHWYAEITNDNRLIWFCSIMADIHNFFELMAFLMAKEKVQTSRSSVQLLLSTQKLSKKTNL